MRQGSILAFLKPQTESTDSSIRKLAAVSTSIEQGAQKGTFDGDIPTDVQGRGMCLPRALPYEQTSYREHGGIKLEDPRAMITAVQKTHLDRLRTLTATLLPVRYSEKFFTECVEAGRDSVISFVAMYESKPVGWIRCRVEPFPNEEKAVYYQIYIQALGILAPYRGLGLASVLLQSALDARKQQLQVRSVYAHVWETNEDALEWYEKRGFERILLQPQYYRRLKPSGAWIVRKELTG